MAHFAESTAIVVRAGAVVAIVLALSVWVHNRVDALEKNAPVSDEKQHQIQKEADKTADLLEQVRADVADIRGDVREIRFMLEQRQASKFP